MKKSNLELLVGLFMIAGVLGLAYLSIGIAKNEFFAAGGYEVRARFSNVSGIRSGSPVMIAGVEIGRIKKVQLQDYEADVTLEIQPEIKLQEDAMASVKTKGLIGEKYIEITPGAADKLVAQGGLLHNTEPAMDIEGLISKFVHGSLPKGSN
jgi:phospholipid/cholesterol/gamma-HCH transport system substrate-binding protein